MWYWCKKSGKIFVKTLLKKYNMNDDDENTVKPEFTSLLKMFDDGGEKNESKFVVAKRIDIFSTIFVAPDVAKLVEEIFRVRKKI